MEFKAIENFKLIDRNKAGGDALFKHEEETLKANFIFYLQADECLSIRVGLHDKALRTAELEEFINDNRHVLKKIVKPEVERVRKEQRARWMDNA